MAKKTGGCGFGLLRAILAMLIIAALVFIVPLAVVLAESSGRIYYSVEETPSRDVAMVMGASVWGDRPSPYLKGRLDVAADLYHSGKAKVLIVSGSISDNEPKTMRSYLMEQGVDYRDIVLDEGGDNSYTSCAVAKRRFGVDQLTVVSQDYHLPRTVAACQLQGVDAIGSADVIKIKNDAYNRYQRRELGANVKLMINAIFDHTPDVGEPSSEVADALARPR